MTASHVPAKITKGAAVLMEIFETDGPGPKVGLSGLVALALGKSVSPRDFADMIQYCRRVLGPQAGKAIVWSSATGQYGFPEDLEDVQKYILLRNNRYAATRAETMAATCSASTAQFGPDPLLMRVQVTHEGYADSLRTVTALYEEHFADERKAKIAALRTGLDAPTQLEERSPV